MGRVPVQPPVDGPVVGGDVRDQAFDPGIHGAHTGCLEQGPSHPATVCRVDDLERDLSGRGVLAHPANDAQGCAVLLCDEGDVSPRRHVREVPQHPWRQVGQPGVVASDARAKGHPLQDRGEGVVVAGGQGPDAEVAAGQHVRRHGTTLR
jgi:hypothetical protein